MFKNITSNDKSLRPFKTYKQFTFNETDSGSGIYAIEAISGSTHGFLTGSALSQSYGVHNAVSASLGLEPYSLGTFYKLPTYFSIKHLYYEYDNVPNRISKNTRYPLYAAGNWTRKWPHGRPELNWGTINPRKLHSKVNVITIPQEFYGEEIKPGSIVLEDSSGATTVELRDDGYGQLYDYAYSASFAAGTPGGSPLTGSVVGNVFYEQGIIAITDTGSLYYSCSIGEEHPFTGKYGSSDGFTLQFQATHTSYEYEYMCNTDTYEYNFTTNPSIIMGRSGSIKVPNGAVYIVNDDVKNPDYDSVMDLILPATTSSYQMSYNPGTTYEAFTTHSEFGTYITNIGLYNDANELLVIGKLSNPVKNDKDLALTFAVRFDS